MPSIDLAHRESGSLKLKFVMCKSSFVKDCIFLLKTTKELTLIIPEKCECLMLQSIDLEICSLNFYQT